jgi:chromosome segregation ATPase
MSEKRSKKLVPPDRINLKDVKEWKKYLDQAKEETQDIKQVLQSIRSTNSNSNDKDVNIKKAEIRQRLSYLDKALNALFTNVKLLPVSEGEKRRLQQEVTTLINEKQELKQSNETQAPKKKDMLFGNEDDLEVGYENTETEELIRNQEIQMKKQEENFGDLVVGVEKIKEITKDLNDELVSSDKDLKTMSKNIDESKSILQKHTKSVDKLRRKTGVPILLWVVIILLAVAIVSFSALMLVVFLPGR